jgi:hypothetical protein
VTRLLDRLTRCDIHDVPLPPLKVAEMEEAAGINPTAVAELWATSGFIPSHYDPDLIDCGSRRCRKRRGLR